MFAALSQAVSNAIVAGIKVRNETPLPILIVCSQLTPLYWGKIMPGETWNLNNEQKMGKVWFTCQVSAYSQKDEPTAASVATSIAAMTVMTPLLILSGPGGAVSTIGIVAAGRYLAEKTKGSVSSSSEELSFSVVGARRDGVYSDGSTLFVRGKLNDAAAYELYYASDDEMRQKPYTGPPTYSEISGLYSALMRLRQDRAEATALAATPEALSVISKISNTKVGIQVRNETAVPLLIVLSQLTPLRELHLLFDFSNVKMSTNFNLISSSITFFLLLYIILINNRLGESRSGRSL
jgi:hypothetical protein